MRIAAFLVPLLMAQSAAAGTYSARAIETASHAAQVGKLWLMGRRLNLSLGDRLCLALALDRHAQVLTSDEAMGKIELPIPITQLRR